MAKIRFFLVVCQVITLLIIGGHGQGSPVDDKLAPMTSEYADEANKFRCDYTYYKEVGGYLKYMEMPTNWIDARAKCALEGATLASPLTPELTAAMRRFANWTYKNGMWTGLNKQFSGADFVSVEGVPLSDMFHSWKNSEPDNENNEEFCLLINAQGDLADVRCKLTMPYACYKKAEPGMAMTNCGTTDEAYKFEKKTGKCYKFHTFPIEWYQGYITCLAEGGHLVIINSVEEKDIVAEMFRKNVPSDDKELMTFIGMQRWNEIGQWRTVHGETLEEAGYAGWRKGQPDHPTYQFCGGLFQNGELDDSFAFISRVKMKSLLCCLILTLFVAHLDASRFRCDYTYSKEAGGYLKYMEMPANWIDARTKCSLEGATLASPLTPELRAAMNQVAKSTCNHGMWTGIYKQFPRADYASIEGTLLRNIPHSWMNCEPDNDNNEEFCLVMDSKGDLADARCNETLPYVCYKKTVPGMAMGSCGTPDKAYNFEKQTGKCYKFHKDTMVWFQAYITCMAEGGHLAILNSDVEKNVVSELFRKTVPSKDKNLITFIGMQKWNETEEWRTVHGETLEEAGYAGWRRGEPNNPSAQFCGGMFQNGELDDSTCTHKFTFVCEKDPEALMCDHEKRRK
ncbi:hypothetical protein O0L34_g14114 [Tuta absoluta]|nr:hypothetical protein O0L34_g14114 [Tuta absoluta]